MILLSVQNDAPVDLCRHAVGTPLLAIRTATELLLGGEGGPLSQSGRELVTVIGDAVRGLERATDLLARIASSTADALQPLPLRPVSIGKLLQANGMRIGTGDGDLASTFIRASSGSLDELLRLMASWVGPEVLLELADSRDRGDSGLMVSFAGAWPFHHEAGEGMLEECLVRQLLVSSGGWSLSLDRSKVAFSWRLADPVATVGDGLLR